MATWKDQVAVGLSFEDMLDWTFIRGESLQEKICKVARQKLQDNHPRTDYQNLEVTLVSIGAEDGDIEVVFSIEG